MAIITIPSSVSGINLPGLGVGGGGPLDSLYKSTALPFYKYPRDLGSSTRSHAVVFTIKRIKETQFKDVEQMALAAKDKFESATQQTSYDWYDGEASTSTVTFGGAVDAVRGVSQAAVGVLDDPKGAAISAAEAAFGALASGAEKASQVVSKVSSFVSSKETDNIAYIALYMPETMVFTNTAHYDDSVTLASAAGALPIIDSAVSKITGALQDNDALKVGLNKFGYIFNPQKQLLFQGIEFRDFSMSFTFTPYSAKEAQDVKEIIKLFRSWSAPQKSYLGGGMFWNPPALFGVDFKFNNSQNLNLPKLKDCVIESVEVNYAPNGMWSAHSDGSPVQTTVTLQLKEIALVDRADIQNGY